jgi:hypothetical protein
MHLRLLFIRQQKTGDPTLQAAVADFINCWAQRISGQEAGAQFPDDICPPISESVEDKQHAAAYCYRVVSALLHIAADDGVARYLAKFGTHGPLWDIFHSQSLEWLQGGSEGGHDAEVDGECILFQLLVCMLHTRDSIRNFVAHVGGHNKAVEQVTRFVVHSGPSGNGWLSRERRDRLCVFEERLKSARLFAGT